MISAVVGRCGPMHRSTRVPHRYTVVRPPSGTFEEMMLFLKGLCANSSRACSFVSTQRWNTCFSFTMRFDSASMSPQSFSVTDLRVICSIRTCILPK